MKKYIGIDVGGTKIKYGVYDELGNKISNGIVDSERHDLNKFIDTINYIKNKYEDIEGVGLSLPCVLDSDLGVILEAGNINAIDGVNIKKMLEERLNINVEIENDANCVGLAEKWIGNGKDYSNFICITIGTGIGGAIILNDKLYTGRNYVAGEFGFMAIDSLENNGLENDYGHVASTTELVNMVRKVKENHPNEINGYEIFKLIKDKDEVVINIYNKWLTNLAIGIRNLCFVLDPEKVLIGGGVSVQERLLEDLKEKLVEVLPKDYNLWSIEACKFFNESGMIGAIYNYIQKNNRV